MSASAADSVADAMKVAENLAIVSARTACRWVTAVADRRDDHGRGIGRSVTVQSPAAAAQFAANVQGGALVF